MRGFFEQRVADSYDSYTGAVETFWLNAPLTTEEIAAAKAQGCAGCVWWTATTTRRAAACHHASKAGAVQADPDFWCSEWRGEPSKETP